MSLSNYKYKLAWGGIHFFFFSIISLYGQDERSTIEKKQKPKSSINIFAKGKGRYLKIHKEHKGIVNISGGVRIELTNWLIEADSVIVNREAQSILIDGIVTFSQRGKLGKNQYSLFRDLKSKNQLNQLKSKRFLYYYKKNYGLLKGISGKVQQFSIKSKMALMLDQDTVSLQDSRFTTCDHKNPHYFFKARKLIINAQGEMVALDMVYYVGRTPLLYLPILTQADFGTGITTQYGHNSYRGHFVQNTFDLSFSQERNSWLPQNWTFKGDYYQNIGYYAGFNLKNKSRWHSYDLELSGAKFYNTNRITSVLGGELRSRYFQNDSLDVTEESENWYQGKLDFFYSPLHNLKENKIIELKINAQQLNHRNFYYEFGQRFLPQSSIDAFTRFVNYDGLAPVDNLTWLISTRFALNKHNLNLFIKRDQQWSNLQNKFNPILDTKPSFNYSFNDIFWVPEKRKWYYSGLNVFANANAQWDSYFTEGTEVKGLFNQNAFFTMATVIRPFHLLSWQPKIGGGANNIKVTSVEESVKTAVEEVASLGSYSYVNTQQIITLGNTNQQFRVDYNLIYSFNERFIDQFKHEKRNDVNFNYSYFFQQNFIFSTLTSRDNRKNDNITSEKQRWQPIQANLKTEWDLLRLIKPYYFGKLRSVKNTELYLNIENLYRHSIRFENALQNDLTFELYGNNFSFFGIPIFKWTSAIIYSHNFLQLRNTWLDFTWSIEFEPFQYWKILLSGKSRVEQFALYKGAGGDLSFTTDFLRSVNIVSEQERKSSLFNLEKLSIGVEHDLHNWSLLLRYTLNRSYRYFGSGSRKANIALFYEQNIYFAFVLKNLNNFGINESQVYRDNPADQF